MLARLLCCPWSSVRLFASAQGGSWKAITNYFYFTPQLGRGYIEMEWPGPNQDIVLKGNYFIGDFSRKLLGTRHPLYFRTIRFAPTGIGWHLLQPIRLQAPTGTWTFVQPNKYEAGRANIAIYNWSLAPRFRSMSQALSRQERSTRFWMRKITSVRRLRAAPMTARRSRYP